MTDDNNLQSKAHEPEQASLSGMLDHPDLLRVRVLPAQFARALGVSKQSVSRWLRDGWITLAADGRLDPAVAIGQLLRRCDPGRLRARWLRQAVTEVQALREAAASADQRVAEVAAKCQADLADLLSRVRFLESYAADADCMFDRMRALMVELELELRATPDSDAWAELIDRIESEAAEHCADDDSDALAADAAEVLDALVPSAAATQEGGRG